MKVGHPEERKEPRLEIRLDALCLEQLLWMMPPTLCS